MSLRHVTSRVTLPSIAALAVASLALAVGPLAVPGAGATSASPTSPVVVAQSDAPILSLGDRGPSVAAWQRQLNVLTRSAYVLQDGVYGATTEQATANFQRLFGLRVDGIVGENTRDVMRFMLAYTRDYTDLFTYEDRKIVGYTSEGGYCFEIQFGLEFSVECGARGRSPLSGQTIAVQGTEPQLMGTFDPVVNAVEVESTGGAALFADVRRNVAGLDRDVWATALAPSGVQAVRALAADGSEVRSLGVDGDGNTYLVLEYGDAGPAVAAWQGRLNVVTNAGLATDGVFGATTWQATVNFQRFFGLAVDGIVGEETREAMEIVYAAVING